MGLSGYEIALLCTIGFNLVFWISVICWRLFIGPYCMSRSSSLDADNTAIDIQGGISSISGTDVVDGPPPPPYEEALKYPTPRQSLSILTVDMSTGDITPLNESIHGYTLSDVQGPPTYMSLSSESLIPERQESNT